MDDITKITVTIELNHTKKRTRVRRIGDRFPINEIVGATPQACASACRDAAYYFLSLATAQTCSLPDVRDQVKVMLSENGVK